MVEICCGSYYDALQAAAGGAKRIELNSGLALGGLTPSVASLLCTRRETDLKIIAMSRPRAGGFCYGPEDFKQMLFDCQMMMHHGADGVAFGCLKADCTIDLAQTEMMVRAVKEKKGEAVFHRAFDMAADPFEAAEQLIGLGADRILTSGRKEKAWDGRQLIRQLQEKFGTRIEIIAGSGIHAQNARELMEETRISQVHSSCKDWIMDPTTLNSEISFAFSQGPSVSCYDAVSGELVRKLIDAVSEKNTY